MEVAGKARVWEAFPCISEALANSLQDVEGLTGQEGRREMLGNLYPGRDGGRGEKGPEGLGWGICSGAELLWLLWFVRNMGVGEFCPHF